MVHPTYMHQAPNHFLYYPILHMSNPPANTYQLSEWAPGMADGEQDKAK